jgi:hypothetical protein
MTKGEAAAMRALKSISRVLKDKSGASLLFVLGVMMLLMAIGISAMHAASANVGFNLRQREYSQVMILGESVHRNIRYSLEHGSGSTDNRLSYQVARAIYRANDSYYSTEYSTNGLDKIELEIAIGSGVIPDVHDNDNLVWVDSITLSFPHQNVIVKPAIPMIPAVTEVIDGNPVVISPEIPRVPKSATVNARMVVDVVIGTRNRTVTSRAVYDYTGGILSEVSYAGAMQFVTNGYGKWSLVSHENVN